MNQSKAVAIALLLSTPLLLGCRTRRAPSNVPPVRQPYQGSDNASPFRSRAAEEDILVVHHHVLEDVLRASHVPSGYDLSVRTVKGGASTPNRYRIGVLDHESGTELYSWWSPAWGSFVLTPRYLLLTDLELEAVKLPLFDATCTPPPPPAEQFPGSSIICITTGDWTELWRLPLPQVNPERRVYRAALLAPHNPRKKVYLATYEDWAPVFYWEVQPRSGSISRFEPTIADLIWYPDRAWLREWKTDDGAVWAR